MHEFGVAWCLCSQSLFAKLRSWNTRPTFDYQANNGLQDVLHPSWGAQHSAVMWVISHHDTALFEYSIHLRWMIIREMPGHPGGSLKQYERSFVERHQHAGSLVGALGIASPNHVKTLVKKGVGRSACAEWMVGTVPHFGRGRQGAGNRCREWRVRRAGWLAPWQRTAVIPYARSNRGVGPERRSPGLPACRSGPCASATSACSA